MTVRAHPTPNTAQHSPSRTRLAHPARLPQREVQQHIVNVHTCSTFERTGWRQATDKAVTYAGCLHTVGTFARTLTINKTTTTTDAYNSSTFTSCMVSSTPRSSAAAAAIDLLDFFFFFFLLGLPAPTIMRRD